MIMPEKAKSPPRINYPFGVVLAFSIILHTTILSQLKWQPHFKEKIDARVEVQLLYSEDPPLLPKPAGPEVKPRPMPEKSAIESQPRIPEKASQVPGEMPSLEPIPKPWLAIESEIANNAENQLETNVPKRQKTLPVPKISIPEQRTPDPLPIQLKASEDPKSLIEQKGPILKTRLKGLDSGQISPRQTNEKFKTEFGDRKTAIKYKIVENSERQPPDAPKINPADNPAIEGDVKYRAIVYKPKPPELDIERNITITLRFTVLPNGEVGEILPVRKGEARLERLAMELLQQYRFEPLFENDMIQNGMIHFSIHRKK